jgi:Phage major capsid protein E
MSLTVTYPTNAEIDETIQAYVPQVDKFIGSGFMPIKPRKTNKVKWTEKNKMRGKTALHKRGNEPHIDDREGSVDREFKPIDFKETDVIGEQEILEKRQEGTWGEPLDLEDVVVETIRERADKTMIAVEETRWAAFRGHLSMSAKGVKVNETFPVQTHTPLVEFDDFANAKPLMVLDEIGDKFDATGASNEGAIHVMSRKTFRLFLQNNNDADLKKFAGSNFVDVMNGLAAFNKLLQDRNGSMVKLTDEGFIEDDENFIRFVKAGEIFTFGKRPMNQKIGEWQATISLHRQENGKPVGGYFSIMEVNGQPSVGSITTSLAQLGAGKNPKFEITGGIYGGPTIKYPQSIVYTKVLEVLGA